jgi:hypothetical protein
MRPKFSMWSDYGAPAQRQWMSASRRGAGSSVGPKILLAAVVVVAGVIGISGIYPQVIDAEWVQDTGTHLPIMSLSTAAAKRVPGTAAAIASPPRRAVTTGQTAASSPRSAPPPEPAQMRPSVAAVEPPPASVLAGAAAPASAAVPAGVSPIAVADIPDAEAKADALPPDPPPAPAAAKPAEKPRMVVAKRKVVVQHHQRSFSGAYAQYGGWGGWGGGGWGGFGGYRRF